MKNNPQRIGEWCMRRLMLCVLLLTMACRAESPVSPELERSIDKQVHSIFNLPPYVDVKVVDRKPSADFSGFDEVRIVVSYGEQVRGQKLLLSKDGKTAYSLTQMDLTRDPDAENMAKMDLQGRPVRGNKDAKVTVVVYDDFQCPYCSRMHQTIVDTLKSYGDKIKVIYKDYPLIQIHPWAERAAIDSECLAKQNGAAYWDFADTVHTSGRQIQGEHRPLTEQQAEVDRIAMEAGKRHSADEKGLGSCIKAQSKTELEASVHEAEGLGVEATPAVFVNGMKMDGAVSEADLRRVLDKALKNAGADAPVKAAAGAPGKQ